MFHSSRLARGDGRKGRRSIGKVVHDLLYEDVIVRSVAESEMVTPMLAGIGGTVSNKYSADLSAHTTRGIHKPQREGKPFGGMPCGYRRERTIVDGEVRSRRVIDPVTAPTVETIWSMIEAGQGWGPIEGLSALLALPAIKHDYFRESVLQAWLTRTAAAMLVLVALILLAAWLVNSLIRRLARHRRATAI